MITSGGIFFSISLPPLYFLAKSLINSLLFINIMEYVVVPNILYIGPLLHPFAYGLYFKEIREPMVNYYRSWCVRFKCNSATVAPLAQRNAQM